MRAIEQCRTAALGGQVYTCPQCERVEYRYHSCRNRHCPQCQQAQAWLEQQQQCWLPVPYFLLTFTVPAGPRASVWAKDWVVYCKPVSTGQTALKYLAHYIFRVALSNRRLVKLDHDHLTFRYTVSQTGKSKLCTLPIEAFIARFLQHAEGAQRFRQSSLLWFLRPRPARPLGRRPPTPGHRLGSISGHCQPSQRTDSHLL